MAASATFVGWPLAFIAVNVAICEAVTPINKVLEMMNEMKTKGIADKKAEEVQFAKFTQWCADTSAEKAKAIEASALEIERLGSFIEKTEVEITDLSERVVELKEDIGRWVVDEKSATDVRKKEKTDYDATHTEYQEIVGALLRAVAVLKESPGKVPQALVQEHMERILRNQRVPTKAKQVMQVFIQTTGKQDPKLFYDAPEAYAYEGQSSGVLAMLQDLHARFLSEMTDLEKQEMNAVHAYQRLVQRFKEMTQLAEQEVSQKEKRLAECKANVAQAKLDKTEEETFKEKNEEYAKQLNELCTQKETDFASRQQLRAEEIEALTKAIEIISSESVAADRLPGGAEAPALAQLPRPDPRRPQLGRVAALLAQRAAAIGSRTLAVAAQKAGEDPFEKVKKMIRDLITKLMEDANAEANHKGWCDAELATNKLTRTNKAEAVDQLHAEVEKLTFTETELSQQIADITAEIEQLDKRVEEATAERKEEKAENEQTIADAKMSQTAVAQALAVLRDFYAKAAQATALLQQTPAEDAPDTFSSPYKGMGAESGGIIGMLEVIESDFARLDVETTASEIQAAAAFKKFVNEAKEDQAVAEAEVDHKRDKLETTRQVLSSTKHDLEQTQAQLDAAEKYYEKLKPSCVDSGISWEERIKRREEEMQSLKEAYKILSGEEVPSYTDMKAEQVSTDGVF
mmetsp:Transcript_112694/g.224167  ORF Transcript_112694/g.224167 Transcript_112694/m.224167 type:complete len:688 (+) Transcript_112694:53-2116(+)